MPAGDANFCSSYQAHPDVADMIAQGTSEFFGAYRRWEEVGEETGRLPSDPSEMLFFFLNRADSESALNRGDGVALGEVRAEHCVHFNDFVASGLGTQTYTSVELQALGIANPAILGAAETIFEAAIRKFLADGTGTLTETEKGLLNGALFLRVKETTTHLSEGAAEDALFIVPGFNVLSFRRNLRDPLWRGVDDFLEDAFSGVGSRMVNVNGVAQLRLGTTGAIFDEVKVAPGFVIKGGV